jgi:hypothetical protein
MRNYNFYVYITTNPDRTVLYIGVKNDLDIGDYMSIAKTRAELLLLQASTSVIILFIMSISHT